MGPKSRWAIQWSTSMSSEWQSWCHFRGVLVHFLLFDSVSRVKRNEMKDLIYSMYYILTPTSLPCSGWVHPSLFKPRKAWIQWYNFVKTKLGFLYPWIRVQLIPQNVALLIWVDDDWLKRRICSTMAGISLCFSTEGKAILWLGSEKTSWITRECTETFLEAKLCHFSFFLWCEKQVGVFFPPRLLFSDGTVMDYISVLRNTLFSLAQQGILFAGSPREILCISIIG